MDLERWLAELCKTYTCKSIDKTSYYYQLKGMCVNSQNSKTKVTITFCQNVRIIHDLLMKQCFGWYEILSRKQTKWEPFEVILSDVRFSFISSNFVRTLGSYFKWSCNDFRLLHILGEMHQKMAWYDHKGAFGVILNDVLANVWVISDLVPTGWDILQRIKTKIRGVVLEDIVHQHGCWWDI